MQELQIGRVYRHFKGDYYLVEGLAHDSESGVPCVIYRKLYGDGGLWVRPLEMFLSKVEKEKYPKTVSAEELDKLFAEGSPLPEELELMEDMDVPLEFRKEPADDNPPIDDDEQDRRLPGCTPQATGIRFEDMGLAVRVAVSGEAASEEERIQAGKTLAELRNTPMFEQLTSGDAEREERIGSLIELHLAAYRKRKQPDSEPAAETIPDTFSISDIV